jgi:seryl-tRNA synthetase
MALRDLFDGDKRSKEELRQLLENAEAGRTALLTALGKAKSEKDAAEQAVNEVRHAAEQREAARRELAVATQRLDKHDRRAVDLRDYRADDIALDQAITTWRTWAAGHTVAGADLDHAVGEFARYVDTVSEARALLNALAPEHLALNPPAQHVDRADVDYGIEL